MGKRNQKYKKNKINKTKSFHLMYRHVSVIKREMLFCPLIIEIRSANFEREIIYLAVNYINFIMTDMFLI